MQPKCFCGITIWVTNLIPFKWSSSQPTGFATALVVVDFKPKLEMPNRSMQFNHKAKEMGECAREAQDVQEGSCRHYQSRVRKPIWRGRKVKYNDTYEWFYSLYIHVFQLQYEPRHTEIQHYQSVWSWRNEMKCASSTQTFASSRKQCCREDIQQ
jgi:hypothetical protein